MQLEQVFQKELKTKTGDKNVPEGDRLLRQILSSLCDLEDYILRKKLDCRKIKI